MWMRHYLRISPDLHQPAGTWPRRRQRQENLPGSSKAPLNQNDSTCVLNGAQTLVPLAAWRCVSMGVGGETSGAHQKLLAGVLMLREASDVAGGVGGGGGGVFSDSHSLLLNKAIFWHVCGFFSYFKFRAPSGSLSL